jgi:hypothetical protein
VVLVRKFVTLKRGPTWRTRTATSLALVGALVMSGGLVMLGTTPATATATTGRGDNGNDKVVVCKYVGTPPGVADHIIVVSRSAIKDWDGVTFPWTFADAQDSVAIRYAVGNEQPGDEELVNCPERREQKVPAGITVTDPCGPSNVTWVAKPDEFFTYAESGGVVTATLKSPDQYVPSGETSWNLADYEKNVPCPVTVPIPADQVAQPPTCDGPGTYSLPADTESIDWSIAPAYAGVGTYTVTADAKAGYTFTDDSTQKQWTVEVLAQLTGPDCILGAQEIAPRVTFTEPTCENLNGASWEGNLGTLVDYALTGTPGLGNTVTVTASIKAAYAEDYAFPEGFDATFEHTYVSLQELECVTGTETTAPKPDREPTVLGTEAAVPTQVDAGLAGLPATGSPADPLLAQLMVGGGLLLLVAGGWLALGSRATGAHVL